MPRTRTQIHLLNKQANSSLCKWLINQPYTFGIFPTLVGTDGQTGNSYSIADYGNLFGAASYVTGTTVANRIFNVYGVNQYTDVDTTTLLNNSKIMPYYMYEGDLYFLSEIYGNIERIKQLIEEEGEDVNKINNNLVK